MPADQIKIELFLAPHNAKLLYKAVRWATSYSWHRPEETTTLKYIADAIQSQAILQGVDIIKKERS
jgi:hypothetical protein